MFGLGQQSICIAILTRVCDGDFSDWNVLSFRSMPFSGHCPSSPRYGFEVAMWLSSCTWRLPSRACPATARERCSPRPARRSRTLEPRASWMDSCRVMICFARGSQSAWHRKVSIPFPERCRQGNSCSTSLFAGSADHANQCWSWTIRRSFCVGSTRSLSWVGWLASGLWMSNAMAR